LKCPYCKNELVWSADHEYDFDEFEKVMMSIFTCNNEECDVIEVRHLHNLGCVIYE